MKEKIKSLVFDFVNENLLDWYEEVSKQKISSRVLRAAVASCIEVALSQTRWIWKPRELDEPSEDDHLLESEVDVNYFVSKVHPQSTGTAGYTLMVTLHNSTLPRNHYATIPLSKFLTEFYPINTITFKDHDA